MPCRVFNVHVYRSHVACRVKLRVKGHVYFNSFLGSPHYVKSVWVHLNQIVLYVLAMETLILLT